MQGSLPEKKIRIRDACCLQKGIVAMIRGKKVRVLVVDDSILFRKMITAGLASDPQIEVVAAARDPFDARDKIIEHRPDVMTCDVEMPRMNGIEFLKRLLPQYPLPVIAVSNISEAVFDAMDAGAVDFVTKPNFKSAQSVEHFIHEMILKVKTASTANLHPRTGQTKTVDLPAGSQQAAHKIIAFGASTGGTEAISSLLKSLPSSTPGIVIVQHIPPVFSQMFADRLHHTTHLNVSEARTGDVVERGRVLIAPGDQHMRIKKIGDRYKVECSPGEKVSGHCPSVDILFTSVAKAAGGDAIGVILTGMGYDGAKGLLAMKRKGARTIGQDEKSCVVYGMPKVAYEIGAVEKQAALRDIPQLLYSLFH